MKKETNHKEPVKVRTKDLSNGNRSIYLDTYINGVRKYEFLKLYLVPETTKEAKSKNKATLDLANAIKSKKIVELQNKQHGFSSIGSKAKMKLFDYTNFIISNHPDRLSTNKVLKTLLVHLVNYRGENILFKQIDIDFIRGFLSYLKNAKQLKSTKETELSNNSQVAYIKMLSAILNRAVVDDIIEVNPLLKIKKEDKPKRQISKREYLTIEELERLEKTPISNENIKRAFLFSCYCGLRYSDICSLKWSNIRSEDNNYTLQIEQKKTKQLLIIPLHTRALKWLPERGSAKTDSLIFKHLPSTKSLCIAIDKWVKSGDIKKHITFHSSRHTHATMLLTLGADLYTVSKLLGHSSIQVTQIYAKVIDESKREAVNLFDKLDKKGGSNE